MRVNNYDHARLGLLIAVIRHGESEAVDSSWERVIRMETFLITLVAVHISKEITFQSNFFQIS